PPKYVRWGRGWGGGVAHTTPGGGGGGGSKTLGIQRAGTAVALLSTPIFHCPFLISSSDQLAADGGESDREHRKRQDEPEDEHRREQPVVELQVHEPQHHHAELCRRKHHQ